MRRRGPSKTVRAEKAPGSTRQKWWTASAASPAYELRGTTGISRWRASAHGSSGSAQRNPSSSRTSRAVWFASVLNPRRRAIGPVLAPLGVLQLLVTDLDDLTQPRRALRAQILVAP